MDDPLCDEALEQLAAWKGHEDPYPPVQIGDAGVTNQHAQCVVIVRCTFMSMRQTPPSGSNGCGMSAQFDCSPSQVTALLAAGAEDNRSELTRKVAGLRDAHIETNGAVPRIVRICPRDEKEWFAHGAPDAWQDRFRREGRSAVILILGMSIEWDAPTTAVQ